IYDAQISDNLILRVIQDRARAGVEIRVIGKIEKSVQGVESRKLYDMRLHVRAMIRDGGTAFVGSQSMRKLELDGRREIGLIVNDSRIAKKMAAVFEAAWALALANGRAADKEKEKEKEKEGEEATPASAVG